MVKRLSYTIDVGATLYQALTQMDRYHVKFLVVIDQQERVCGTLTDGDIRRGFLQRVQLDDSVDVAMCETFTAVRISDGLSEVLEAFQDARIEFLPVLNAQKKLHNIITRRGLQALLLKNLEFRMDFDFESLDEVSLEHMIFSRPWGFYKTTLLNDIFRSKVIHVMPGQAMSLQSHRRREEYWVIVHGSGTIQLGESIHPAMPGNMFFIPKGCRHRLTNTSDRGTLILVEVQLGDYFGEDDICRYDDLYGRT